MNVCLVADCERRVEARGLCHNHYNTWWRTGSIPARAVLHSQRRYCTCYGDDIPTPDPNGMCPDCLRLVEHLATA